MPNRSTPFTVTTVVGVKPEPLIVTIWSEPTFSALIVLGDRLVISKPVPPPPPVTLIGQPFESVALPEPLFLTMTSPGPASVGIGHVIDVPPPEDASPRTLTVGSAPVDVTFLFVNQTSLPVVENCVP